MLLCVLFIHRHVNMWVFDLKDLGCSLLNMCNLEKIALKLSRKTGERETMWDGTLIFSFVYPKQY